MNIEELMIGDLVKSDLGTVYKVKGVRTLDGGEVLVSTGAADIWIEYSLVESIPLTPEILEKNGWKIGMYSRFNLEDGKWLDFYHHENRLRKWWEGIDEWQNHAKVKEINFQCHCTYVHELQHALRLCGLNELADNFKIQYYEVSKPRSEKAIRLAKERKLKRQNNMVNEEKAKEIAGLCDGCLDVRKNLTCQFDCINVGLYCGALKMADWKDSQHKETIENYQKRIAELEEQIATITAVPNSKS